MGAQCTCAVSRKQKQKKGRGKIAPHPVLECGSLSLEEELGPGSFQSSQYRIVYLSPLLATKGSPSDGDICWENPDSLTPFRDSPSASADAVEQFEQYLDENDGSVLEVAPTERTVPPFSCGWRRQLRRPAVFSSFPGHQCLPPADSSPGRREKRWAGHRAGFLLLLRDR